MSVLNNNRVLKERIKIQYMDAGHTYLASNLCKLRESMRLSRQSLADIVGSSAAHIAKLETDRTRDPSWRVIENLACFFGVNSRALMEEEIVLLDRKDQALKRANSNFTDSQWESLIDFIDGTTRRQADEGVFRK